jgi:hypothetical protein
MKPKTFHRILDQIQYSIFKKLDKFGTYQRVDEGAARDAVSRTMEAAKHYFGNQKINDNDKTS